MNRLGYKCNYDRAEDIFNEIASVTPSYGGITYARIEENEGICWPCPTKDHPGTAILHVGKPANGKGVLKALEWVPSPEAQLPEYPIQLTTNRLIYHYHSLTMCARSEAISKHAPSKFVEINEEDAKALGIEQGATIKISSKRGSITASALVSDRVARGVAAMPFHWADGANVLSDSEALDPISKIPGLKHIGVKIEKA